eukprot:NODE_290_length_3023_cov_60.588276_g252_i0.p1 GENE.NODE_290_length_3023_cov_60.588276_g252_i0~~NODE_290_length_3023_cov_60.588276_g252_i0.p1  ORF type:complete len:957 (-),score=193.74 NODE_290_length_3023_cov_60.588276_g252_i0:96-2966(-)
MIRTRLLITGLKGNGVIGIRREDKNNWERRVPLTPMQVKELVQSGIKVLVQSSTIRCFTDEDYKDSGAEIVEDLSPASTILAVKEVPSHLLIPERTYLFFSHTIKAQPSNMPLLDTALQRKVRLIDFERITNKHGRIVKFGPFAGYAGVVDTLHALGVSLLARGYATPFLHVSCSKEYRSLDSARADLLTLGELIRKKGLPKEICPLTFVVTGTGSVSTAAQQMLHNLPCLYVDPTQLKSIWERDNPDRHNIYVAVTSTPHMVKPKDPNTIFSSKEYYSHPERYVPIFHELVAPYARVVINGIYWEPKYPRLLSLVQAKELYRENKLPWLALGDITCDPDGSIELFRHSTTIGDPFYCFDMEKMETVDMKHIDTLKDPLIVLGVDHLPAEFPCESSQWFGEPLVPLVKKIAWSNGELPFPEQTDIPEEIKKAVITCHGDLTPDYKYINELRAKREAINIEKGINRILVLGAGMVAGPTVDYLLRDPTNRVMLADRSIRKAESLLEEFCPNEFSGQGRSYGSHGRAQAVLLDASEQGELDTLVQHADIVVCLLPQSLIEKVVRTCIKFKKNIVTANYPSTELFELSQEAKTAKITIVTEVGLVPGLDVMIAKDILHRISQNGGVIESLESYSGALPSVEYSDNPIGYKFSWSPIGVLESCRKDASWLYGGHETHLSSEYLFDVAASYSKYSGLNLLSIPEGNVMDYAKQWELNSSETKTVMRSTFRYNGFNRFMIACRILGLLESTPVVPGTTWKELIQKAVSHSLGVSRTMDETDIMALLSVSLHRRQREIKKLASESAGLSLYLTQKSPFNPTAVDLESELMLKSFKELRLMSDDPVEGSTYIEGLAHHLGGQLKYRGQERDFVLLHQLYKCRYPSSGRRTVFTSTMTHRGKNSTRTATSFCVGTPIAIATQLVLEGEIKKTGLCRPITPNIYQPILQRCVKEGIYINEDEREFH